MKTSRSLVVCFILSILIGLFLFISGATLICFQQAADVIFGLNGGNSIGHDPLAVEMGIRQLAIGLMVVCLALARQTWALGIVMVIGTLVPLADFISFAPQIGVLSALRHGATVPVVLGLGIFFLARKGR